MKITVTIKRNPDCDYENDLNDSTRITLNKDSADEVDLLKLFRQVLSATGNNPDKLQVLHYTLEAINDYEHDARYSDPEGVLVGIRVREPNRYSQAIETENEDEQYDEAFLAPRVSKDEEDEEQD